MTPQEQVAHHEAEKGFVAEWKKLPRDEQKRTPLLEYLRTKMNLSPERLARFEVH
jgi:hypothetical protein